MFKHLMALFICAALSMTTSCTDEGPGSPSNPPGNKPPVGNDDDSPSNINGTDIAPGTTLCGLISDIKSGEGIRDVVVSDGFNCTRTDQNGVYQLKGDVRAKFIFYSTPSGYEVARSVQNGLPEFYHQIGLWKKVFRQDFKLTRLAGGKETKFTLFCLADTQNSAPNVSRFVDETIPDVESAARKYPNVYAITLGDITDANRKDIWTKMKGAMSNRSVAFFQIMGNHDHLNESNPSVQTTYWKSIENFQNTFGPHNYSFDRGDVHIVAMDNALHGEKPDGGGNEEFASGFYDWQFEWLKQDLSYVPKDKMVLLCTHIPFRSGRPGNHSDNRFRDKTLKLLAGFKEAHIMVGHTHYTENYIHTVDGKEIYEHIQSAVCGQFWRSSFSGDGTPNGYGIYEIDGPRVTNWHYKATGFDSGFQVRVYNADQTFTYPMMNENGLPLSGKYAPYCFREQSGTILGGKLPENSIVANVWNRDKDTKVSLWQDGQKVGDMKYLAGKRDLYAAYWFYEVYGCSWSSLGVCNHLFTGTIDPAKAFEVRVEDGRGNVYKTTSMTTNYDGVGYDFRMKNR